MRTIWRNSPLTLQISLPKYHPGCLLGLHSRPCGEVSGKDSLFPIHVLFCSLQSWLYPCSSPQPDLVKATCDLVYKPGGHWPVWALDNCCIARVQFPLLVSFCDRSLLAVLLTFLLPSACYVLAPLSHDSYTHLTSPSVFLTASSVTLCPKDTSS